MWVYRGHERSVKSAAPVLSRLLGWLRAEDLHGQFLGVLPSPAHHRANPTSLHEDGRALDWRPSSDATGWRLAHTMTAYPDGGDIQLVLWKDYQWGGRHGPVWVWTGRHDHDTHLHIETRGWA